MPPKLDETYEPRLWRCEECRQILGVVMRDAERVRRLWVFSKDYAEGAVPTTADLRRARRGLYKIHGVDMAQGVECAKCGAISEWSMSKEALDKLISTMKKRSVVAVETVAFVAVSLTDGVE